MADLISVIVPVYNVAEDLPRCLDSILSQTYPHMEIIAVDDGSSDHSGRILDKYAEIHPSIHVIHQENGGVTSARLRGVAEASGDWIGFVDGDDEIEQDMYGRLLRNALEYKADISHCGYQMVFADGRVNFFHNTETLMQQDSITALRELLSGERIEPGLCNKLFHKSLFAGLSMPTDIKINEDLLMNYYLFSAAHQTVFDDWCPYHYIVRSTSASRSKLNEHKIYDPLRVKERILEAAPDELRPDAQKALVSTCVYSYCSLVQQKGVDARQAKQDFRSKLKEHDDWCQMLPKRTRLLARLITKAPCLFALSYPIYTKYFQNSRYT